MDVTLVPLRNSSAASTVSSSEIQLDAVSIEAPVAQFASLEAGMMAIAVPSTRNQRTLEAIAGSLDRGNDWLNGACESIADGRWAVLGFAISGSSTAARNCLRVLGEDQKDLGLSPEGTQVINQMMFLARLTGRTAEALSSGFMNRDSSLEAVDQRESFSEFFSQVTVLREQRKATLDYLSQLSASARLSENRD